MASTRQRRSGAACMTASCDHWCGASSQFTTTHRKSAIPVVNCKDSPSRARRRWCSDAMPSPRRAVARACAVLPSARRRRERCLRRARPAHDLPGPVGWRRTRRRAPRRSEGSRRASRADRLHRRHEHGFDRRRRLCRRNDDRRDDDRDRGHLDAATGQGELASPAAVHAAQDRRSLHPVRRGARRPRRRDPTSQGGHHRGTARDGAARPGEKQRLPRIRPAADPLPRRRHRSRDRPGRRVRSRRVGERHARLHVRAGRGRARRIRPPHFRGWRVDQQPAGGRGARVRRGHRHRRESRHAPHEARRADIGIGRDGADDQHPDRAERGEIARVAEADRHPDRAEARRVLGGELRRAREDRADRRSGSACGKRPSRVPGARTR